MRAILLHTLYSARRDKFLTGILIGMIVAAILGSVLGSTAIIENDEMRAIYAASACRFISIIGIMVFISFYIKKLFENKEMDVFLSRMPSRTKIVSSFFNAFIVISTALVVQSMVIVYLIYLHNIVNVLIWGMSLMLEIIIVTSFSLFFSIVIRSSTVGLMMCFAAYFLSRVIGSFVAYIDVTGFYLSFNSVIEVFLKITSVLIPRLDLFSKTDIIIYGNYSLSSFGILILQTFIYSIFLLLCSIFDMRCKEF